MTFEEEQRFLAAIRNYCSTAERVDKTIRYAVAGIQLESERIRAHAVDMETVAALSLNARMYKTSKKVIADKLEKHSGMNALRWDDQIKELRK